MRHGASFCVSEQMLHVINVPENILLTVWQTKLSNQDISYTCVALVKAARTLSGGGV